MSTRAWNEIIIICDFTINKRCVRTPLPAAVEERNSGRRATSADPVGKSSRSCTIFAFACRPTTFGHCAWKKKKPNGGYCRFRLPDTGTSADYVSLSPRCCVVLCSGRITEHARDKYSLTRRVGKAPDRRQQR